MAARRSGSVPELQQPAAGSEMARRGTTMRGAKRLAGLAHARARRPVPDQLCGALHRSRCIGNLHGGAGRKRKRRRFGEVVHVRPDDHRRARGESLDEILAPEGDRKSVV